MKNSKNRSTFCEVTGKNVLPPVLTQCRSQITLWHQHILGIYNKLHIKYVHKNKTVSNCLYICWSLFEIKTQKWVTSMESETNVCYVYRSDLKQ